MFSPTIPPDSGMIVKHKPRIIETKMGDGYNQRAGDGINADLIECSPKWTNLPQTVALYIEAFFIAQAGWQKFTWTRPKGTSAQEFVCKTWSISWKKGNYADIQAEFEQVAL